MTLNRTPSPTRPRLRRRAAFGVAALALGAGLLTGCGDDDGNGDAGGVSESEFCALIAEFETSLDASEPTPEQWDEAQGVAGDLADLGVPESFPSEHRDEFDEVLDLVRSQEPAEFAAAMSSWDEEKLASMEKIGDYFEETCEPLQDE
ncbi:hypothetical protein NODU109028_20480 [Nocardioides dubius]